MNDNEEKWEEPLEENGLTLGPEETLQREIEKLKEQKEILQEKNRQLHKRVNALSNEGPNTQPEAPAIKKNELIPFLIAISLFSALLFLFRN